jgi:hypothetical protein
LGVALAFLLGVSSPAPCSPSPLPLIAWALVRFLDNGVLGVGFGVGLVVALVVVFVGLDGVGVAGIGVASSVAGIGVGEEAGKGVAGGGITMSWSMVSEILSCVIAGR